MSFIENVRNIGPRRQLLLAAGILVVIAAILVAGYVLVIRKPYALLFTNLRTADAATIVADLDKKKVPYKLQDDGASILVPKSQRDATRLALVDEDLPLKGTVGFELFNKSDMGLTEFSQRINYQRALQGELERTMMTMDDVESARVHLALSEPTIFRDDRRPSKASVTLVPRAGKAIDSGTVRGIQRLVAAAVPDLAAGDVVVLDARGAAVSDEATASSTVAPLVQQKQAIELYYAARARRAIADVYPAGADVAVSAKTDPSPTSIDGDAAGLSNWTPTTRSFPIAITITLPQAPPAEVEARIRATAARAAALNPAIGDVLLIATSAQGGAASGPMFAAGSAAPSLPRLDHSTPKPPAPAGVTSVLTTVMIALIGLALALQLWFRSPRRLTPNQRLQLARRLEHMLENEDSHVAPSV